MKSDGGFPGEDVQYRRKGIIFYRKRLEKYTVLIIREVPGSELGSKTGLFTEVFRGFLTAGTTTIVP
jgi:hypothetical protein